MDPLLLTQVLRTTLSLDDPQAVPAPLVWVAVWGHRLVESVSWDLDLASDTVVA